MTTTHRFPLALVLLTSLAGCPTPQPDVDTGAYDGGGDVGRIDGGRDSGGTDAGIDVGELVAPTFRNPVDMEDMALATEALRLMGASEAGGTGSCHTCHGLTVESITHFRELSDTAWSTCLSDLELATSDDAEEALRCIRIGTRYATEQLGIYAAGGHLPWFTYAFARARGAAYGPELERFLTRAAMPPGGDGGWTQGEFDIVTEWFQRGTPHVEDILSGSVPGVCTDRIGPEIATIVADSATTGWTARNEAAGILMHGCAGAASVRECLGDYPEASTLSIADGWSVVPGSTARILFETDYNSSYWTRSSADGRFVAHGGGRSSGASVIDLFRGVAIGVDASYDPGFFPDNSGMMFQGGGTSVCATSVLTTGSPTHLTLSEPGCTGAIGVPLYQHMGASLEGGDLWAVSSAWSGDPGGSATDPTLFTDPGQTTTFHAMRNTGSGFVSGGTTTIATPNAGSAILSPSMRMMVTQVSGSGGVPIGYVVHRLNITGASGAHSISAPEIASYCYPGGKPAMSYDDRWLVTHHRATDEDAVELGFTGPGDAGWAAYRGTSNVYLIDLLTGERTLITRVDPGQEALFPHFRSDGWLYYLLRAGGTPEYVVATDAALILAED